ncbi:MAG: helix-turn-helix transcriptional regulator [Spirochaetaceae bacterium]|jgi:transcriptional regulator with XRE-family HTH domain|nr:helix-turn-helix transcriptional regulator [Spirochaetaceae bacterium]
MKLQYIFISNLKKFRKLRGLSQMRLAQLCDTSGNYIGEIEIGRRIPSFEKIEDIAAALRVPSYQLFMEERDQTAPEKHTAQDFLMDLPYSVKEEITAHFMTSVRTCIIDAFDALHYADHTIQPLKE